MTKTVPLLACAVLIASAGAAMASPPAAKGKKLYCWNENGNKVCGDALPASAVNNERTELSANSGMATGKVARALTPQEQALVDAQAKADKEAAALAEAKARREHAMAESYETEDDLRRAFGERTAVLDEAIKASRLGVEGRRQSLVALLRRAGENELAGTLVPKVMQDNVRLQHEQLLRQQALLVQQQADRELIDEELAAALERYNALKKPATGG